MNNLLSYLIVIILYPYIFADYLAKKLIKDKGWHAIFIWFVLMIETYIFSIALYYFEHRY
jgi:hypothetical protein